MIWSETLSDGWRKTFLGLLSPPPLHPKKHSFSRLQSFRSATTGTTKRKTKEASGPDEVDSSIKWQIWSGVRDEYLKAASSKFSSEQLKCFVFQDWTKDFVFKSIRAEQSRVAHQETLNEGHKVFTWLLIKSLKLWMSKFFWFKLNLSEEPRGLVHRWSDPDVSTRCDAEGWRCSTLLKEA